MNGEQTATFEEQRLQDEAGQVERIEHSGATPEATCTLTVLDVQPEPAVNSTPEPEPLAPPDRAAAAGHVERFLGHQGSLRDATVAELNDDEVREVLEAGQDRHSAKSVIKGVISRAYDRRRDAAANEARGRESALRRSALASAALEQLEGLSAEQAAMLASKLTPEQQEAAIGGCRPPTELTNAVKGTPSR